jgi:hypothetical protein
MTQTYLVLITVFVLSRFLLEAFGPEYVTWWHVEVEFDALVSEISITRLFWVLPVFLGLRFVSESLGGWKEMVIANFTYVGWGIILMILLHALDYFLALGTHYGRGRFVGTSIGQLTALFGWDINPSGPADDPSMLHFCGSLLLMGIAANILCFITIKWNGRASAVEGSN